MAVGSVHYISVSRTTTATDRLARFATGSTMPADPFASLAWPAYSGQTGAVKGAVFSTVKEPIQASPR